MNLAQVIVKPVLTEKTVERTGAGKYTFIVHEEATKIDVKHALYTLYGVHAAQVNMLKGLPKYRLGKNRRSMQKKQATRRAIVTLKAGESLDTTTLKTDKTKK